jgi:hypothetical protein
MACPQVAEGGDGLQIWRAAANILNKQLWTAHKGWSSSLGVGRGANNAKSKLNVKYHEGSQTWTDYLDKRRKPMKTDMRSGTWNV